MPTLQDRLLLLRRLGRRRREGALAAALPHCSPSEADIVAAEVFEALAGSSRGPALLGAVLGSWALLGHQTRAIALAASGEGLGELLKRLASAERTAERCACAAVCEHVLRAAGGSAAARIEAARQLTVLVDDADASARGCAMDALVGVLVPPAGTGVESLRTEELRELDLALGIAIEGYDSHRHAGVIRAALHLAHRPIGPELRAFLARDDGPSHMALRGAARRAVAEVGVERCVAWLAIPALAAMGSQWIEQGGPSVQTQLLERVHVLELRGRAAALRRLRAPEKLLPNDARLAELPSGLRRASIRLARLIAKGERRLLHLSGFLADADPLIRLQAALQIGRDPPSQASDAALADFSLDANAVVSLGATSAISMAQSVPRRLALVTALQSLTKSTHPGTRRLAEEALCGFDPFHAGEGDRRWHNGVAGRRACAADRIGFMNEARRLLRGGSAREKLAALGVVERLRLCPSFEAEAVDFARGRDQRLAAKAVRVLSRIPTSSARDALREALVHPDPRVRADAVEAISRCRPEEADAEFGAWTREESARLRGNVLRHLVTRGVPGAVDELTVMLRDEREGHRLAALWVTERTVRLELTSMVIEMIGNDPDPAVRARARRCAQCLQAHARAGWRHPAAINPPEARAARLKGAA